MFCPGTRGLSTSEDGLAVFGLELWLSREKLLRLEVVENDKKATPESSFRENRSLVTRTDLNFSHSHLAIHDSVRGG